MYHLDYTVYCCAICKTKYCTVYTITNIVVLFVKLANVPATLYRCASNCVFQLVAVSQLPTIQSAQYTGPFLTYVALWAQEVVGAPPPLTP